MRDSHVHRPLEFRASIPAGVVHLSYTVSSLHFTAFALGTILAGLGGHWLIYRLGRKNALWLGLFGLALGDVGLSLGRNPVLTIGFCLLMGLVGSLALSVTSSGLSDHYAGQGENAAVAQSEANMFASLVSVVPPLLVGWFVQIGAGWRTTLWSALLIVLVLWVGLWKVSIPEEKPTVTEKSANCSHRAHFALPALFWAYWCAVLLAVAIEFCRVSWSVDFIEKSFSVPRAMAAQSLSVFLAGMIAGRLASSLLVKRFSVVWVLSASLLTAGAGFACYWLASNAWLSLIGLLLTGLGEASLYPLIITLAMDAAKGNTNTASVGIHAAYSVVPVLIVFTFGVIQLATRLARRETA